MEIDCGIYDDLPNNEEILLDKIAKLEAEINSLQTHIQSLEADIAKLCEKITEMKKVQDNLEKNISELYKTAKTEIDRKNRMISELRSQLEQYTRPGRSSVTSYKRSHETFLESDAKRIKRCDDSKVRNTQSPSSVKRSRSRSKSREKHKSSHREKSKDRKRTEHRSNSHEKCEEYYTHEQKGSQKSKTSSSRDRQESKVYYKVLSVSMNKEIAKEKAAPRKKKDNVERLAGGKDTNKKIPTENKLAKDVKTTTESLNTKNTVGKGIKKDKRSDKEDAQQKPNEKKMPENCQDENSVKKTLKEIKKDEPSEKKEDTQETMNGSVANVKKMQKECGNDNYKTSKEKNSKITESKYGAALPVSIRMPNLLNSRKIEGCAVKSDNLEKNHATLCKTEGTKEAVAEIDLTNASAEKKVNESTSSNTNTVVCTNEEFTEGEHKKGTKAKMDTLRIEDVTKKLQRRLVENTKPLPEDTLLNVSFGSSSDPKESPPNKCLLDFIMHATFSNDEAQNGSKNSKNSNDEKNVDKVENKEVESECESKVETETVQEKDDGDTSDKQDKGQYNSVLEETVNKKIKENVAVDKEGQDGDKKTVSDSEKKICEKEAVNEKTKVDDNLEMLEKQKEEKHDKNSKLDHEKEDENIDKLLLSNKIMKKKTKMENNFNMQDRKHEQKDEMKISSDNEATKSSPKPASADSKTYIQVINKNNTVVEQNTNERNAKSLPISDKLGSEINELHEDQKASKARVESVVKVDTQVNTDAATEPPKQGRKQSNETATKSDKKIDLKDVGDSKLKKAKDGAPKKETKEKPIASTKNDKHEDEIRESCRVLRSATRRNSCKEKLEKSNNAILDQENQSDSKSKQSKSEDNCSDPSTVNLTHEGEIPVLHLSDSSDHTHNDNSLFNITLNMENSAAISSTPEPKTDFCSAKQTNKILCDSDTLNVSADVNFSSECKILNTSSARKRRRAIITLID